MRCAGKIIVIMKWELFFEVEEVVKKSIRDEFGLLLEISLFTIDLSNRRLLKYAYLFVFAITHAATVSVCITETIILRTEFFYFSLSLHYTLLAILGLLYTLFMNFRNEFSYEYHAVWASGIYDYQEPHRAELNKLKNEILRERKLLIFLPVFIILIGIILFVALFIDEWTGVTTKTYVNGVNVRLVIPFLVPFDTHEGFAYYAVSGWLLLEVAFTVMSIASAGLLYAVGSQRILLQLRILRWSVAHIGERAEEFYRSTADSNVVDSEALQRCLLICFKRNIAHYCRIRSYYHLFANELASFMIFSAFIVGTIVIALSMVVLNEGMLTLGNMLSFTSMALAEVGNMFLLCSYGERISTECEKLIDDVYSIPWYNSAYNEEFKQILVIFKSLIRNPLTTKAGGFVDVNMNTFRSIMNTAYSYFNLINASKHKK